MHTCMHDHAEHATLKKTGGMLAIGDAVAATGYMDVAFKGGAFHVTGAASKVCVCARRAHTRSLARALLLLPPPSPPSRPLVP